MYDDEENAIEGVTVTLTDKDDTEVVNTTTDVNGVITQQEVTRRYYLAITDTNHVILDNEWTNYSPFLLTVKKAGYETITAPFSFEETNLRQPKVFEFKMKRSEYLRKDAQGRFYHALNADDRGSSALLKRM